MTGIESKICEAYRNLCSTYIDEEDEIVLTGFSRGAFTAQCLARLINDVGLLHRFWVNHELPRIFKLWATRNEDSQNELKTCCDELHKQDKLRRGIMIDAYAVWDTVKSLGPPWLNMMSRATSKNFDFVDENLPLNIKRAYHALALDERRRDFYPMVLEKSEQPPPDQILKQCWFLGTHSDVGGGNKNPGLANIALYWMLFLLQGDGLVRFKDMIKNAPQDGSILKVNGDIQMYNSYHTYWRMLPSKHRVVGQKRGHEKIHASVYFITHFVEAQSFKSQPLTHFEYTEELPDGNESSTPGWLARDDAFHIYEQELSRLEAKALDQWIVQDWLRDVPGVTTKDIQEIKGFIAA